MQNDYMSTDNRFQIEWNGWEESQNNYQHIDFRNIVDTWENYGNKIEYSLLYISTEMW